MEQQLIKSSSGMGRNPSQCNLYARRAHQRQASTIHKAPVCRVGGASAEGAKLKADRAHQIQDTSLTNGQPNLSEPVSQAQSVRACTSAEAWHDAATSSPQRPTKNIPEHGHGFTTCKEAHRQHTICRGARSKTNIPRTQTRRISPQQTMRQVKTTCEASINNLRNHYVSCRVS